MNFIIDIFFGSILPFFILPALIIVTLVKIRPWKLSLAVLVLFIVVFCYGLVIGSFQPRREIRALRDANQALQDAANRSQPDK